jgi:hypothetical protein
MIILLRELNRLFDMTSEYFRLKYRLPILLSDPLGGAVGSEHDKRCMAEECFCDSGRKVKNGGAGRAQEEYR